MNPYSAGHKHSLSTTPCSGNKSKWTLLLCSSSPICSPVQKDTTSYHGSQPHVWQSPAPPGQEASSSFGFIICMYTLTNVKYPSQNPPSSMQWLWDADTSPLLLSFSNSTKVVVVVVVLLPKVREEDYELETRREGEREGEERSEPEAHGFRSGWILFIQDVLFSQWAACRKCKKLSCIKRKTALISKQAGTCRRSWHCMGRYRSQPGVVST